MMKEIDSFSRIFERTDTRYTKDVWEVQEKDPQASFNKLYLRLEGADFGIIENCSYKSTHGIIFQKSKFLKDEDCDGAAFAQEKEEKTFLFAELKSNMDAQKIVQAYKQMVFTLLKLHTMFSLCEGYDIYNYRLIGIIACKPPKDDKQKMKLKDSYWMMLNKKGEVPSEMRCLTKLYHDHKIECRVKDIPFLNNREYHEGFRDKTFTIYLKMSEKYEDSELIVDLNRLED